MADPPFHKNFRERKSALCSRGYFSQSKSAFAKLTSNFEVNREVKCAVNHEVSLPWSIKLTSTTVSESPDSLLNSNRVGNQDGKQVGKQVKRL